MRKLDFSSKFKGMNKRWWTSCRRDRIVLSLLFCRLPMTSVGNTSLNKKWRRSVPLPTLWPFNSCSWIFGRCRQSSSVLVSTITDGRCLLWLDDSWAKWSVCHCDRWWWSEQIFWNHKIVCQYKVGSEVTKSNLLQGWEFSCESTQCSWFITVNIAHRDLQVEHQVSLDCWSFRLVCTDKVCTHCDVPHSIIIHINHRFLLKFMFDFHLF